MRFILLLVCVVCAWSQSVKLSDFNYNSKAKTYFRKDLSKNVVKRIYNQLYKNQKIGNKEGRLRVQPKVISGKLTKPNWSSYRGPNVSETVYFQIRIGKKGNPDIIILNSNLPLQAQSLIVSALLKTKFSPGIHSKSGKPVRSWIDLNEYYNN